MSDEVKSPEGAAEESRAVLEKQIEGVAENLRAAAAQGAGLNLQTAVNLSPADCKLMAEPPHELLPHFASRVVAENWHEHILQFLEAVVLKLHGDTAPTEEQ